MIHARASLFDFISSKIISDCSGITTPEMKAALIVSGQPPSFPNCLNINLYDDYGIMRSNPPYRRIISTFDLYIEISDPSNPEDAERKAYDVIHKINNFMAVQFCEKKNFSVNPAVSLRSNVTWTESYPLNWRSSFVHSDRYVHKTCRFRARYFEEKLT